MYDELVKSLRQCAEASCAGCKYDLVQIGCRGLLQHEAADAIEALSATVEGYESSTNMALVEKDGETAIEFRPKWIPVTERLPENGQDVLVMVHWRDYPENMMCYGRKYKTRWYLWNGELGELIKGFDITHWMPLPQAPKEET